MPAANSSIEVAPTISRCIGGASNAGHEQQRTPKPLRHKCFTCAPCRCSNDNETVALQMVDERATHTAPKLIKQACTFTGPKRSSNVPSETRTRIESANSSTEVAPTISRCIGGASNVGREHKRPPKLVRHKCCTSAPYQMVDGRATHTAPKLIEQACTFTGPKRSSSVPSETRTGISMRLRSTVKGTAHGTC